MMATVYFKPERAWSEAGEALAMRAMRGSAYDLEEGDRLLFLRNAKEVVRIFDSNSATLAVAGDGVQDADWEWVTDLAAIPVSSIAWIDLAP